MDTMDFTHFLHVNHLLTLLFTVNAATPNSIPSPEVLALLGQNLHQFDTWHVPTQQPAIGVETGISEVASPYARAVMGSRASVATLCVSGPLHAISTNPCEASRKLAERGIPNIGVVAALANKPDYVAPEYNRSASSH